MTTLIFGCRGYLGQRFLNTLPEAESTTADIADPFAVAEQLDRFRPDVVINCAGKTGRPNIDWCETHRAETLRANVTGPLVLFDACAERGIYLVQLSSGCVYEGDRGGQGYREVDPPNFTGSYYAQTKIAADALLADYPLLLLRLRMPLEGSLHPRTLLGKLIHYPRLIDVANSITYTPDFLAAAEQLIARRATGLFHVVNPGTTSPYRIMTVYRERVDPEHRFDVLPLEELDRVTEARRSNCVLSTAKLRGLGIEMRPVEDALEDAMRHLQAAAVR